MNPGELPLLLIIDDDPDQLALARLAALRAGGLRVIEAESGPEALIQLQARADTQLAPPDLVLTDLKMPEINGVELMRLIRHRPEMRDVPVIFLTSNVYNRDRIVAHIAGADAFFQKPIHFADLVALMKVLPAYVPLASRKPAVAGEPATLPLTH